METLKLYFLFSFLHGEKQLLDKLDKYSLQMSTLIYLLFQIPNHPNFCTTTTDAFTNDHC